MENYKFTELLHNVYQKDLSRVGGKAINLGGLIKAGLPVPGGFVLVTDSYRKYINFNNIDIKINKLLNNIDYDDFEGIKEISNEIKNIFKSGKIPADIIIEIDNLYEQFGNPEVVVRSSATLEDSPETSFAGQYDSFLNVKDKEQLYLAIKKCWASLWNSRALIYRFKQNINNNKLAHAVIVQKFIKAEKSGIVFTANPINNRRDQILISSSWGLGEAIVNGDVIPDQWIIDKMSYKVVKEKIVEKRKMAALKDNGTKLIDVPKEKQNNPTLDLSSVFDLMKLALNAEIYFEKPQDIEWVFSNNQFYLVQSRPITTLFPKLKPENSSNELRIYINFLLSDKVMPEPLTPMGEDVWKKFLKKVLPKAWIKSAAGRLFVDATELIRLERWWDKLQDNPTAMEPLTIKTLIEILKSNKVRLINQKKPLIKLFPTFLSVLNLSFLKFIITSIPKAIYGIIFPPEKIVKSAYRFGETQIKNLEEKAKMLKTVEEKIEFIEENAPTVYFFIPLKVLYYVISSVTYIDKVKKIISKHLDDISLLSKVEKSLPNNITTEMGMELLQIASNFDQAGKQPTPENLEIKNFMKKYGHRAYLEIDPGTPRWEEKPEYIINLIKSYINNKSYKKSIEKFFQDKEEAEKAIQEITSQLKAKGVYRDARKVKKLLIKYRKLFGIRELPKYIMTKGVSIFRKIFLEIGEELVKEGRLENKHEIFFVNMQDIKSEKELQEKVILNQKKYKKELIRISVPRVVTSTGETFFSPGVSFKDNEYEGIPVSPGIYEGKVRVLESPEEGNKLQKGDILVTKATNPAWTPLFLVIGGLITELGGPISHGSVVAREYDLPAIVGLKDATTKFKDGQLIKMNGETGKVEILKSHL